jgi:hypothetical protein
MMNRNVLNVCGVRMVISQSIWRPRRRLGTTNARGGASCVAGSHEAAGWAVVELVVVVMRVDVGCDNGSMTPVVFVLFAVGASCTSLRLIGVTDDACINCSRSVSMSKNDIDGFMNGKGAPRDRIIFFSHRSDSSHKLVFFYINFQTTYGDFNARCLFCLLGRSFLRDRPCALSVGFENCVLGY